MPANPASTLRSLGGRARTGELLSAGVHPRDLYAAAARGEIEAVARGAWALPATDEGDPDLIAVSTRMPQAVFGVLTALVLHDLTDEIPRQIHVLLTHGRHPPHIPGVPIVGYHVAPSRLREGVETRRLGNHEIQLTDVPRTVVDTFKYRRRIGMTVARDALVEALRRRLTTPGAILAEAERAHVRTILAPYLEAIG